ncbi:unnamed protein product [Prunus armeniaca]
MSNLRAMTSELKSSLIEKDSELNSLAADLVSRKDAFFCLERKNADVSLSYDKLLARFHAYHKSAKKSKSEAIIDAYKLGYLHCVDGTTPLYAIDDVDIETLCPDSPLVEGGAEEQAAREDEAEEDAVDEMMADVAEQADRATEGVVDQAEVEVAAAQRSPAGGPPGRTPGVFCISLRMVLLRKLASAKAPLKGLRACSAHPLGWFPLVSWRVPGPSLRGSRRVLHIP